MESDLNMEVAELLRKHFGVRLPERMQAEAAGRVLGVLEEEHSELSPQWVYEIFEDHYLNKRTYFDVTEAHFKQQDGIYAMTTIAQNGLLRVVEAQGNGRVDAVCNTIRQYFDISFVLSEFEEYALTPESSSKAIAFVEITYKEKSFWGAGIDDDIVKAAIKALVVAVNSMLESNQIESVQDERYIAMRNYIQANYQTVTLGSMAAAFHLSEPYVSKYIRDKSGKTFGDLVTGVRMKKAKTLLRNSKLTVESVAELAGYPNVEHFNRRFKKLFNMTPVEYRNDNRMH